MQNKTNLCNPIPYLSVQSCTKETSDLRQITYKCQDLRVGVTRLPHCQRNQHHDGQSILTANLTWGAYRLHRGPLHQGVRKSSCEGSWPSNFSKPTTYAVAPCQHQSCRWLPTPKLHAGVEEMQWHQLVRAGTHQIRPCCPKNIAALQLWGSLVVPYKFVHVGLGYLELYGYPSS